MKKRFVGFLIILIIIFCFNVFAQTSKGATICNINKECGLSDGICPELFFPSGVSCYIADPDCCSIKKAVWSSSPNSAVPITNLKEGQSTYMYVETLNCDERNAYFDVISVKDKFFGNEEFLATTFGPIIVPSTNKFSVKWTGFIDPATVDGGISQFKFKVRINPELSSELINVEGEETPASSDLDNSCKDGIDNDADGCADEVNDCADKVESNTDPTECPGYSGSCAGWKCSAGDCINGIKSVNCPALPSGCNLALPPPYVKCYEKTVPFPFFGKFNVAVVIFLLIGYYGFRIYKQKSKKAPRKRK